MTKNLKIDAINGIMFPTGIHRFQHILIFSEENVNDLVHSFYFSALKGIMVLFVFIVSTKFFKAFHFCSFGASCVFAFFKECAIECGWILFCRTQSCNFIFDAIFRTITEREKYFFWLCTSLLVLFILLTQLSYSAIVWLPFIFTLTDFRGHFMFLNEFFIF